MAHSHDDTPDDNPAGFLNAVAVLCLLLAGGGLGWAITSMPKIPDVTDDSFTLEPPAVDLQRLEKERTKKHGSPDLSDGEEKLEELYSVVKESNRMQFDSPNPKAAHEAQVLVVHHANEAITAVGPDAYMAIGEKMFDGCSEGFQELLDALKSDDIERQQARQDPGDSFAKYRDWCGKAFPAMEDFGMVTGEGEWKNPDVGPVVFDIMNRFRWGAVMDLRKPPWEQLTEYEYEILTLWRASLDSVPKNKRVTWVIQASKELPGLEHHQVLGNLHFQAGDVAAALREYEAACSKNRQDAYLQKKCNYLRAKVSPNGGPNG